MGCVGIRSQGQGRAGRLAGWAGACTGQQQHGRACTAACLQRHPLTPALDTPVPHALSLPSGDPRYINAHFTAGRGAVLMARVLPNTAARRERLREYLDAATERCMQARCERHAVLRPSPGGHMHAGVLAGRRGNPIRTPVAAQQRLRGARCEAGLHRSGAEAPGAARPLPCQSSPICRLADCS